MSIFQKFIKVDHYGTCTCGIGAELSNGVCGCPDGLVLDGSGTICYDGIDSSFDQTQEGSIKNKRSHWSRITKYDWSRLNQ